MGDATPRAIQPQNEPLSSAKLGEEGAGTDTDGDLYVNCSDIDKENAETPQSAAAVVQKVQMTKKAPRAKKRKNLRQKPASSASEKKATPRSHDIGDHYQNVILMKSPKQGEPVTEAIYLKSEFEENREVGRSPAEKQSTIFEGIAGPPENQ